MAKLTTELFKGASLLLAGAAVAAAAYAAGVSAARAQSAPPGPPASSGATATVVDAQRVTMSAGAIRLDDYAVVTRRDLAGCEALAGKIAAALTDPEENALGRARCIEATFILPAPEEGEARVFVADPTKTDEEMLAEWFPAQ